MAGINGMGAWSNSNPFGSQDPEVVRVAAEEKIVGNQGDQIQAQPSGQDEVNQSENTLTNGDVRKSDLDHFGSMNIIERVPSTEEPLLPLNSRDVCAFIVNKMIGTGIFTTPATVLFLTKSKGEALGLWILGFAYVLIR